MTNRISSDEIDGGSTAKDAHLGRRVFQQTPGLTPGSLYEEVVVDGRPVGYVIRRSQRFVVWSERAEEVHVHGDGLAEARIATMWEGPRGAAISGDELWCVVIGLGFIAFPLRPGGPVKSHWRRPALPRWALRLPFQGELAGAVLFTGVRALDGHRFALSTKWGLDNPWTIRVWVYDADTDTIGEPTDIVDETMRQASVRATRSPVFSAEPQLAARLRADGAVTTADAGTSFEPDGRGGETVVEKGRVVGRVLCRSAKFVAWEELGSMICVEGEGLPWLLLDDMYGGANAAAISDDEEWCVAVGCGFRARRLRVGGEFRSHGADPRAVRWFRSVEALSGHSFLLREALPAGGTIEHIYDADRDELRPRTSQ